MKCEFSALVFYYFDFESIDFYGFSSSSEQSESKKVEEIKMEANRTNTIEEEANCSIPKGGPIYISNLISPLTSVPEFQNSVLRQLQVVYSFIITISLLRSYLLQYSAMVFFWSLIFCFCHDFLCYL